jgi:hypothetical protein
MTVNNIPPRRELGVGNRSSKPDIDEVIASARNGIAVQPADTQPENP